MIPSFICTPKHNFLITGKKLTREIIFDQKQIEPNLILLIKT